MITGVLILLVFFVFAGLMYARIMPALLAVPCMAVVMSFAAGVGPAGVGAIVVTGASALAPVYVAVIFGALLGRVTLDTGIARSIVTFAAEFGGERPPVVAAVLCLAVALLFMSLSGLGAVIMVGSIVLPVMMTVGVPRRVAATLFLMAFALGFIFNIVNWKFYTQYFGVTQQQMTGYALLLAAIDALVLIVYAIVAFRSHRGYATWAVTAERTPARVPAYALITPILPIVLYFALHLDPVLAFSFSAIYGALTASPRSIVPTLVAAAIRGVEDVAPAIVLFVGIGMLLTATKAPQFAAALHPLVSSPIFGNPLAFVVIFGLLSPLVLYRGPLNPFGVGIAIFTALLAAHVLPPLVLVAAVMAVVQVQNVCDPTNTQNVWVANFTGVPVAEITKRTLPYQVAVATAACIVVAVAGTALFHVRAFNSPVARAQAATLPPAGMFVGARGTRRIAVGNDGTPDARAAETEVVSALAKPGFTVFALQSTPNDGDCARKPYAAYVTVTSTRFTIIEGTDLDIGLHLEDCGGWTAGEWHDHAVQPQPDAQLARSLGAQGASRLLQWASAQPQRWSNLLAYGLAFAAGDAPTYYYSLFKTVDGNMRAYVRGGGPAYAAGLRSNDIINKLDGRYWWEYGTYQTQSRAYDGLPHSFEIDRGGKVLTIELGEAFAS